MEPAGSPDFVTTRWSAVRALGAASTFSSRRAMAELCERYWYPVYAFLRRRGQDPEAAADTAQGFFAFIIEKGAFSKADPSRGRFRTFLLAALKNFDAHQKRAARALKRGGGRPLLSFSALEAEARYRAEPADSLTAEKAYERRWALALIARALAALRGEYEGRDQAPLFEALKPGLEGGEVEAYRSIAGRLGMSEEAVKAAAYRMRKRCAALLRQEVADLVDDGEEESELALLLAALRSG